MDSEVDLQNIIVLEDHFFAPRIRGPMSGHVVEGQTSREPLAGLESIASFDAWMTDQGSNTFFNLFGQFAHGHARFRNRLHVLTYLAVSLGSLAIVAHEVIVHLLHGGLVANFSGRSAFEIVVGVGVLDDLARRIRLAMEEVCKWPSRRRGLMAAGCLRLLLLVILAFSFLA
jgi:hypothetical protein